MRKVDKDFTEALLSNKNKRESGKEGLRREIVSGQYFLYGTKVAYLSEPNAVTGKYECVVIIPRLELRTMTTRRVINSLLDACGKGLTLKRMKGKDVLYCPLTGNNFPLEERPFTVYCSIP